MRAPGTNATRAALVALALAGVGGCHGCKSEPALRLTYEVDVAHAYGRGHDVTLVMEATRGVIARRLDELAARAAVTTRGQELVVELAALQPDDLRVVEDVLARSGRLELKMVDDGGSAAFFGGLKESAYPQGEGIAPYEETAPDGLDEGGHKKRVKASYARMACRPPKHPGESVGECLARFEAWASTTGVPDDHQLGFESVTELAAAAEPPRFEQVGWRTVYLYGRADLTGAAVEEARAGRDPGAGAYHVSLTFRPAGADRLEEMTGANVNRRMAIVVDDVVESAPVILAKIAGGHAQITMGVGEPEQQLRDARQLEIVLGSGSLPAPLHLMSEEVLTKGR